MTKAIGGLSKGEVEMLAFLRQYIETNSYTPTYQEMLDALGYKSKNSVSVIIRDLETSGYVKRIAGKKHAIQITERGMAVRLPAASAP